MYGGLRGAGIVSGTVLILWSRRICSRSSYNQRKFRECARKQCGFLCTHSNGTCAREREREREMRQARADAFIWLHRNWRGNCDSEKAQQLWIRYRRLTDGLSQGLSEQLRLILAPTQATRLCGDFRTGKRLNMRRGRIALYI